MEMRHKTSKSLFAYWDGVRADRLTPRRFEIEPSQIAHILSSTFILERLDTASFRYRLAGTTVCEHFGMELRGANFVDGWTPEDRIAIEHDLSALSTQGAVSLLQIEAAPKGRASTPFEILLLPLRHTGDKIDRVLGSFSALEAPIWLGHAALTTKRVISRNLIWPAGSAMTGSDHVAVEPPMLMQPANARIVRSQRRQFRVFEGGLSQSGGEDA